MGTLVDNMQGLADEVIGSFTGRKGELENLRKEINEMLVRFEAERQKMGAELQKKLDGFLVDLERHVQTLFKQFEEDRMVTQKELMTAAAIFEEMEARMEYLRS